MRRATSANYSCHNVHPDFYPRSPCGERLFKGDHGHISGDISIHALLAESDHQPRPTRPCKKLFLSTLSLRRATIAHFDNNIVAPNFYPRSPCGERRIPQNQLSADGNFYPRSPCGERPSCSLRYWSRAIISIHALLAESDSWQTCATEQQPNFYPRSPCGERRVLRS